MDLLSADIIQEIASYLDAHTLSRFLSITKRLWSLRTDVRLINRIRPYQEFITNGDHTSGLIESARRKNTPQLDYFFTKQIDWNTVIEIGAREGRKDLVDLSLNSGDGNVEFGLEGAAEGGHVDLVEFFIAKGAWNLGSATIIAIKFGKISVVNFFLEKGVDWWDDFMCEAAFSGNRTLVDLMIQKGASNWDEALFAAVKGGQIDLINFFQSKGARDWNRALLHAIWFHTNQDIIDLCIQKGADDWDAALIAAVEELNLDLVKFFVAKGATNLNDAIERVNGESECEEIVRYLVECGANQLNIPLNKAAAHGNLALVKFLVKSGELNWYAAIQAAVNWGYLPIIKFFVEECENNTPTAFWNAFMLDSIGLATSKQIAKYLAETVADDFIGGLTISAKVGDAELVKFFGDKVMEAPVLTWHNLMIMAVYGKNKDIVEYLVSRGANKFNLGLRAAVLLPEDQAMDFVKYFVSLGADDWANGLSLAIQHDKAALIEYFLERRMTGLYEAVEQASKFRSKGPLELMVGNDNVLSVASGTGLTWALRNNRIRFDSLDHLNTLLCFYVSVGDLSLAKSLVDLGANDWNGALLYAAAKGVPSVAEWIIEQGATNLKEAKEIAVQRGRKHTAIMLAEKCGEKLTLSTAEDANGLFSMFD